MGVLDFVDDFTRLNTELSEWSQKTFGSDDERGPIGALKHLAKASVESAVRMVMTSAKTGTCIRRQWQDSRY